MALNHQQPDAKDLSDSSRKLDFSLCPSTDIDKRPLITLGNGATCSETDRPKEYGVSVALASVAYITNDADSHNPAAQPKSYCAVSIELSFALQRKLKEADVPFRLRLKDNASFNQYYYFPKNQETVVISQEHEQKEVEIRPDINVSTGLGPQVAVKGMGSLRKMQRQLNHTFRRNGSESTPSQDTDIELAWTFQNSSKSHDYPANHTLLLLVYHTSNSESEAHQEKTGFFPFDIELLDRVKIASSGSGRWPLGKRIPPGGWRFPIRGNYKSDEVLELLRDARDTGCASISLRRLALESSL